MDDVIRFLLGQVALCGKSGAYPTEIFEFLKLYAASSEDRVLTQVEGFPGAQVTASTSTLSDAATESAIWSWLTRHPGLFVGKSGQASHLTLDEVHAHNESAITTCRVEHQNDPESDIHSLHCASTADSPILKLYATEEHVWHAVAGHGIDPSRIPPQDFDCLCVIAQHRDAGVVQPKLVKLTGQDPRSVPTRTQRLCDAGYVVKIPTMVNSGRTSLLILKKFASWVQRDPPETTDAAAGQPETSAPPTPARLGKTKFGEHEQKIREALAIVQETQIIVWDDLKKKISILQGGSQAKALATAFRDLERLGFVQRVKAQGAQDTNSKRYHRCIKLLRNPTPIELSKFFSADHVIGKTLEGKDPFLDESRSKPTVLSGQRLHWNPNRQLTHVLRDVVDAAGNDGVTLQGIRESAVGVTYERPIDHVIAQLVDFPSISQPDHLKHLGILRDTVAIGRANMYIHYAGHRLQYLVQQGKISKGEGLTGYSREQEIGPFGFPPINKTAVKVQTQAKYLSSRADAFGESAKDKGQPRPVVASSKTGRPRGRPRKNAQAPSTTSGAPVVKGSRPLRNSQAPKRNDLATHDVEAQSDLLQSSGPRAYNTRPNGGKSAGTPDMSIGTDTALTHREQSALIDRPSNGIFIGPLFELKRPGQRGRRPKSRLAVVKTPKLMELAWFIASPSIQVDGSRRPSVDGTGQAHNGVLPNGSDAAEHERLAIQPTDAIEERMKNTSNDPLHTGHTSDEVIVLGGGTNEASVRPKKVKDRHSRSATKVKSQKGIRPAVSGGAVAAKRRQIIVDIVTNAGGVYPGGNELWYPFTSMWQPYNRGSQPDSRTIRNSVSALVDNGTLHRVTFNFQNKLGIVTVKTVLTLPDIEPDDERVKNLQERIAAADPRLYLPETVYIAPELRPNVKRSEKPTQTVPVHEEKVDLRYIPAYLRKRTTSQAGNEVAIEPKRKRMRKSERVEPVSTSAESSPTPSSPGTVEPHLDLIDRSDTIAEYSTYQTTVEEPESEAITIGSPNHVEDIQEDPPSPAPSTPVTPKKRAPPRQGPKPRRLASLLDKTRLPLPLPTDNQEAKKTRARGPQFWDRGGGWEFRLYIAILIVKLLLGGLEQSIDWDIVTSMLDEQTSAEKLPTKWNHVRASFKEVGDAINDEIREKLATGFEDGSLATVNYDDFRSYDWKGLLDWTLTGVDPSRFDGGLPRTRARLDETYDIAITPVQTLVPYYEDTITATIQQRRMLLHKHADVEELTKEPNLHVESGRQGLARSWVHAVMTTPDAEYDAEAATAKLALLSENELIATVKLLRTERIITTENKGRLFPGRGYDFSEKYTSRLGSNVEADQLREAAKFKKALDLRFAASGRSQFDLDCRDGAYLALVNMVGHGQVRTDHDDNLPKSSQLVESGYVTRKMDKSRLVFDFALEPTSLYQTGNPLNMSVDPPRCQQAYVDSAAGRVDATMIPMWYDMNGKVVPIMWEVARAIVALQLSSRPWITFLRLTDSLKSFLQAFEVELVLQWFVDIGAARYSDTGRRSVVLGEWWWMMLADAVK